MLELRDVVGRLATAVFSSPSGSQRRVTLAALLSGLVLLAGCNSADDKSSGEKKQAGAQAELADSGTATGVGAPAPPPESPEHIDMLREYQIQDDVVYGKASKDNWVLFTEGVNSASLVRIPVEPPPEYDLELDVTPLNESGSLLVGIVLEKAHCLVKIDSWPKQGFLTALDSVDGRRPGYKTYPLQDLVYRGQLL